MGISTKKDQTETPSSAGSIRSASTTTTTAAVANNAAPSSSIA